MLCEEGGEVKDASFFEDDDDDNEGGDVADGEKPGAEEGLHVGSFEELFASEGFFHHVADEEGGEKGGDGHHPGGGYIIECIEKVFAVDGLPVREEGFGAGEGGRNPEDKDGEGGEEDRLGPFPRKKFHQVCDENFEERDRRGEGGKDKEEEKDGGDDEAAGKFGKEDRHGFKDKTGTSFGGHIEGKDDGKNHHGRHERHEEGHRRHNKGGAGHVFAGLEVAAVCDDDAETDT